MSADPLELLDDSIRAQLGFLNRDATLVRERHEQRLGPVDDEQSKQGFVALVGTVSEAGAPPAGQASEGQHLAVAPTAPAATERGCPSQAPRQNCGRWADPVTTTDGNALVELIERDAEQIPEVVRRLSTNQLIRALEGAPPHRPSSWWAACTNAATDMQDQAPDPRGHQALDRHLETVLALYAQQ